MTVVGLHEQKTRTDRQIKTNMKKQGLRECEASINVLVQDIVAYRPIAKRWLCKQRPFLGNG
jgi:hypothetical protein